MRWIRSLAPTYRSAAALTAAILACGLIAVAGPAVAQTPAPAITLSLPAATIGQAVQVVGNGFGPRTPVTVQLCGASAQHGSTDCDVVAGQTVVSDDAGGFTAQVVVRFPPVPCPCVVWATSTGGDSSATAPLGVVTAPFANGSPSASSSAEVPSSTASTALSGTPSARPASRSPFVALVVASVLVVLVGLLIEARRRRHRRGRHFRGAARPLPAPEPRPAATPAAAEPELEPAPAPSAVTAAPIHLAEPVRCPRTRIRFSLAGTPEAERVALCGDFNDWSPRATPMALVDGRWQVDLELSQLRSYRYRFLVDGSRWENDWSPDLFVRNDFGTLDSVVVVGTHERCADGTPITPLPPRFRAAPPAPAGTPTSRQVNGVGEPSGPDLATDDHRRAVEVTAAPNGTSADQVVLDLTDRHDDSRARRSSSVGGRLLRRRR